MSRFTSLLALLASGFAALAQNPVPPPVALPLPGAAPAPAALPSTVASGDGVQLQFPNADISQVLDAYERLTGRRLIRDNQVIGQVNIVINERIPREEAVRIIEINLLMNGFSLVPAGGNLWKVIGTGKNPRNFGIPIFSITRDERDNLTLEEELARLPEGEQVITYLAPLLYQDPTEVAQVLGQAIPPNPALGGAAITPLPKAGAVLITENTIIIRGILRILREIDLAPAEVVSEFFTLQRADAKDVLEKLQDIIQPKTQTGTPGAAPAVTRPAQPRNNIVVTPEGLPAPNQPVATVENTGPNTIEVNSGRVLSEDAVVVGKTILQADERTNRIHIVTRPVNMKFFRKLIEQLDADTVFGVPVTRALKFVQAGDILEALRKSISDPGAKDEGGGTGTRPSGTTRGSTGSTQNFSDNNRFGGSQLGGLGGSGGGGTGGFSEGLNTEEREVIPEAFTVGNTRIIADKRANAIIVIGNKDVQEKVFAFLNEIDIRSPQVTIHTVIGTLSLDNTESLGVDYILRQGGKLGSTTTSTDGSTTTGNSVVNTGGLIGTSGLNINNLLNQNSVRQIGALGAGGLSGFFAVGNALDVIVSALQSTGRFKVTASPNVFTSNNKKAVISSGTDIAVPTNIQSSLNGINNNNSNAINASVQFRTVALQVEVLPLINSEGEVALEIVVKIDELTGESDTIGGNPIPRIATRVLKTNVTVPNGATILLGGLRREQDTIRKTGVPYLSKIPGVGALFRTTRKNRTRDELVIMLRPVVTATAGEPIRDRERQMDGFMLEPDLEAALTPQNVRRAVPANEPFRKAAPVLREETVTVETKRLPLSPK